MKKILLGAIALLSMHGAMAQRTCNTMNVHQRLLEAYPQYAANRAALEQQTQSYAAHQPHGAQRSVIMIPVVVHVIYNNAAGNISDAQIQSQITRLNLDYHKLNADTASVPAVWDSLIADCNIQFCLAQRDPNGLPTNGIVRVHTTVSSWLDDDKVKYTAQGGDDAWPASSYLNIWVCDLGQSLLGYSQFPGGPAATDGCVILNTAFGDRTGTVQAPYDLGRTVSHEVGHWLNLYHTWGDDNGACTGSDLVADTPNEADANYGAPAFPLTDNCSPNSPGVMFMNYMDYSDDVALYMFTKGQNVRIQANFANGGGHASILNSLGCVAPGGGPYANFTADKLNICAGDAVQFTDMSFDTPTVYQWTFAGGTPATSTDVNPLVTYNTPGTYDVTLTVTKDTSSNTKTINGYITVKGTTPLPLAEGFEGTFPPAGWSVVNPDNQTAWAQKTTAGGFGLSSNSAYLDNYTQQNIRGQYDYLYTPVLDFTQGITADSKLKFDYAYAQKRSTSRDSLFVQYSTDCGATWFTLWKKGGAGLATAHALYGNSVFAPADTNWVRDSTISLAAMDGIAGVQFAFVNLSNHGNAIYLDNVNIDAVVQPHTGVTTISEAARVSVVPNPVKDRCAVFVELPQQANISLALYNVIGQQVWSHDLGTTGSTSQSIDLSGYPAGVYTVRVQAGEIAYTRKVVKE
ncbi:MAG: T9SS type A sorting domain-containing protein [Bacteroidetes bacterium]|nr:T9SS type A sorting domain-containing protein [Bacteroidota bacterium]